MIFAEQLDRRGAVAHRVRVERFPFIVGRAYSCDLVVDDPHVAPQQIVVDETPEGIVTVQDAGLPGHTATLAGAGELVIAIGRMRLRLRDRDFEVGPALPLVRRRPFLEWLLEHWSAPVAIFALQALLGLLWIHQSTWRETNLADPLTTVLFGILGVAAWCGGWALVTRFLRGRGRFPAHVAVAGLLLIASQLVDEAIQVLRFVVAHIEVIQWTDVIGTAALVVLLLYGHLRVAAVGSRRVRAGVALAGGALVLGLQALQQSQSQPDWVSDLPYWSRLEPVPVAWLSRHTPEQFFARTERIDAELEELAKQKE